MTDVDLEYLVRVDGPGAVTPVAECKEDDNSASTKEKCQTIL
jgi:hypothetical protein